MKATKSAELRSIDPAQLLKRIEESETRLTALSFQRSIGQLENTAQFRTIRRDIARMRTILSEREQKKNAA